MKLLEQMQQKIKMKGLRTVTEAKRGIPCPRCNGREFEVEESGRYIVKDAARDV